MLSLTDSADDDTLIHSDDPRLRLYLILFWDKVSPVPLNVCISTHLMIRIMNRRFYRGAGGAPAQSLLQTPTTLWRRPT